MKRFPIQLSIEVPENAGEVLEIIERPGMFAAVQKSLFRASIKLAMKEVESELKDLDLKSLPDASDMYGRR